MLRKSSHSNYMDFASCEQVSTSASSGLNVASISATQTSTSLCEASPTDGLDSAMLTEREDRDSDSSLSEARFRTVTPRKDKPILTGGNDDISEAEHDLLQRLDESVASGTIEEAPQEQVLGSASGVEHDNHCKAEQPQLTVNNAHSETVDPTCSFTAQRFSISDDALKFRLPSEAELAKNMARRRFSWPLQIEKCFVKLDSFEQYLESVAKTKASYEIYLRGVKYFFAIVHCSALETPDIVDAFVELYEKQILHRMWSLELLSPKLAWTRVVLHGFRHLLNFIIMAAGDAENDKALRFATTCGPRFIIPLKKQLAAQKDIRHQRRQLIDIERRKHLPPVDVINGAAHAAMVDMVILHNAYLASFQHDRKLPSIVRRLLNTIAVGFAVSRTFIGRPGDDC